MRILQITWFGIFGGIERHVVDLTKSLKAFGHDVEVCIQHQEGAISDELKPSGVKVHFIGIKNGLDVIGALRFEKFLCVNKYDVVHVHTHNFLANLILLLFCNKPKTFTEHSGEHNKNKRWKQDLFYRIFIHQYQKVIANSNFTGDMLIKNKLVNLKKLVVIPNGIGLERFTNITIDRNQKRKELGLDLETIIVGTIGRVWHRKGIDLFIDAALELVKRKRDRKFVFFVIGEGPEKAKYEMRVNELCDKVDIRFLGARGDVPELLSVFDYYLFTSRFETFGLVLVEAMASGVPIVGFNIPGANEVVENGRTALLVEPFNTKKLVDSILNLISNKKLYSEMSKNGKYRVREFFTIDKNAQKVLQVYEEATLLVKGYEL